jgi:hypothetical protein
LKTENKKTEKKEERKTYLDLPGRAAHGAAQHHSPTLALNRSPTPAHHTPSF